MNRPYIVVITEIWLTTRSRPLEKLKTDCKARGIPARALLRDNESNGLASILHALFG